MGVVCFDSVLSKASSTTTAKMKAAAELYLFDASDSTKIVT